MKREEFFLWLPENVVSKFRITYEDSFSSTPRIDLPDFQDNRSRQQIVLSLSIRFTGTLWACLFTGNHNKLALSVDSGKLEVTGFDEVPASLSELFVASAKRYPLFAELSPQREIENILYLESETFTHHWLKRILTTLHFVLPIPIPKIHMTTESDTYGRVIVEYVYTDKKLRKKRRRYLSLARHYGHLSSVRIKPYDECEFEISDSLLSARITSKTEFSSPDSLTVETTNVVVSNRQINRSGSVHLLLRKLRDFPYKSAKPWETFVRQVGILPIGSPHSVCARNISKRVQEVWYQESLPKAMNLNTGSNLG